jgi:hypothetical protein
MGIINKDRDYIINEKYNRENKEGSDHSILKEYHGILSIYH